MIDNIIYEGDGGLYFRGHDSERGFHVQYFSLGDLPSLISKCVKEDKRVYVCLPIDLVEKMYGGVNDGC